MKKAAVVWSSPNTDGLTASAKPETPAGAMKNDGIMKCMKELLIHYQGT